MTLKVGLLAAITLCASCLVYSLQILDTATNTPRSLALATVNISTHITSTPHPSDVVNRKLHRFQNVSSNKNTTNTFPHIEDEHKINRTNLERSHPMMTNVTGISSRKELAQPFLPDSRHLTSDSATYREMRLVRDVGTRTGPEFRVMSVNALLLVQAIIFRYEEWSIEIPRGWTLRLSLGDALHLVPCLQTLFTDEAVEDSPTRTLYRKLTVMFHTLRTMSSSLPVTLQPRFRLHTLRCRTDGQTQELLRCFTVRLRRLIRYVRDVIMNADPSFHANGTDRNTGCDLESLQSPRQIMSFFVAANEYLSVAITLF